ncbi:SUMF1/EgtB/PvdO family nonheme iron enzyme [Thermostilla marina]
MVCRIVPTPEGAVRRKPHVFRACMLIAVAVGLSIAVASEMKSLAATPTPTHVQANTDAGPYQGRALTAYRIRTTKAAVTDLMARYGDAYPRGKEYLAALDRLEDDHAAGKPDTASRLTQLQREALLDNPLLSGMEILAVRRRSARYDPDAKDKKIGYSAAPGLEYGFPSNHECNSSLPKTGYDNALIRFRPRSGESQTVYRPDDGGYVGEVDLHFDGDRILFTKSDAQSWKIYEMRLDGGRPRVAVSMPEDVDCMDPCYLPDGRIVFGSTACLQSVPCWHGQKLVTNLYRAEPDGNGVRRLCYDQDHNFHPVVLPNGQVLYHRWDYTGINHIFMRQLMVMNPDGTNQRAVYGSNSWYPNALYFPRPLPGSSNRLIAILSGYHGPHRMGQLVLLDLTKGWFEAQGIVQRISGRGEPIRPDVRDNLVQKDWPKFLHPYPLSEKFFLVACQEAPNAPWGIYLADVFDNLVPIRIEQDWGLFEPIPIRPQPKPPVIPDRVDLAQKDAVVYLHDVYNGPGLAGVPRGTIKNLRIVAYDFGYPGLAGPDKVGFGGPWEVMRILGTVPVEEDGSACFRVPANTPLAIQPLDAEGKAVQLMRSWYTAMPGEKISCVGCHETPAQTGRQRIARAALRDPVPITPWRGPPRGFDFAREVQPVLDAYCVDCHDGNRASPDLRAEELRPDYEGRRISDLGIKRLHPEMAKATGGVLRFTPAYEALLPYIRRVSIEDDVHMLTPGEYHADTSPLIQLLQKGHGGVNLDAEAWDRLVTWIDLNAPCHGTWHEVFPIPDGMHERRLALRRATGGPDEDYEVIPPTPGYVGPPNPRRKLLRAEAPKLAGWPLSPRQATARQQALEPHRMTLEIDEGVAVEFVRIPAGKFIMGSTDGFPDESPPTVVSIDRPFWISSHEITNRQFRLLFPDHDPGYYQKRHARADDPGLPLDGLDQPAVRVSWIQATAFCRALSRRWNRNVRLPTEAQWEYAARAGSDRDFWFADKTEDFSAFENLGDFAFANGHLPQITGGLAHLIREGGLTADTRFDDHAEVTVPVGSYRPNPWGLFDMAGNAAEWTRTTYAPYPYRDDGRNAERPEGEKVVRGGSYFDPPKWSRASVRRSYPAWQRVFNVGFRIVIEDDSDTLAAAP